MDDFILNKRINKIKELSKEERIKMVWMWSRQNVITLNQFKKLITYC